MSKEKVRKDSYGKKLAKFLAKEFLEYRLGIEATQKNIALFANYILKFEEKVSRN